MKIKAALTIDINQYENIKPEIEIDTENWEEAKDLIRSLWVEFHGLCRPLENKVNELAQMAKNGKPASVVDYQEVTNGDPFSPNGRVINEAKKEFNRRQYIQHDSIRKAALEHKIYKSNEKTNNN